jgi:hypothetical protein
MPTQSRNQSRQYDIDWKKERDRVDLARLVTYELGPAPGRRGERSASRLYWNCPFHNDPNPSFCVEVDSSSWHCFGCGAKGDGATLLMKLDNLSFPEAIRRVVEWRDGRSGSRASTSRIGSGPRPPAPKAAPADDEAAATGMSASDAEAIATAAIDRLWSPAGAPALEGLRARGLNDRTIGEAGLGFVSGQSVPRRDGTGTYPVTGIAIPWRERGRLVLLKVRQPDGRAPKYLEIYRVPNWRSGLYPRPEVVRVGRPVIIVEGELDALLLGQEVAELDLPVVTLGAASARPEAATHQALLKAPKWYIATDGDDAGEVAAQRWPAHAKRVRPPELIGRPCKDWTECHLSEVRLKEFWEAVLAGSPAPAAKEPRIDLDRPGQVDPGPDIIVNRPGGSVSRSAYEEVYADPDDPERKAIRGEGCQSTPLDIDDIPF